MNPRFGLTAHSNPEAGMKILITRRAVAAALISVFSGGTLHAGPAQFGVIGSPIDLSANVQEAILPGGTVFQELQAVVRHRAGPETKRRTPAPFRQGRQRLGAIDQHLPRICILACRIERQWRGWR